MEPKPPFKVKAIYDYKSDHDEDLSFTIGQIITVSEIEDDDWFTGSYDGLSGMFPKNFVQIVPKREVPQPPVAPIPVDAESEGEEESDEQPIEQSINKAEATPVQPIDSEEPAVEEGKDSTETAKDVPEPTQEPIEPKIEPKIKPMGVFPNQKREDPYAIKKQFIASAKSSYVPQYKPRDDSFLIGGHHDNKPPPADIVKSTQVEDVNEEPEEKMSLQERIKLLQQRQKEEAERESAAIKRQELRKQKAAEERERLKKEREEAAAAAPEEHPGLDEDTPIEQEVEVERRKSLSRTNTGRSLESSHTGTSRKSIDHGEIEDPLGETKEEEEEEVDEGEDDEDLKRQKLVERMAKISGGRNMFGMMGMSPFGAPKPKAKEPEPEPEVEEEEKEEERAAPIPIMPFADPAALEKLKKKAEPEPEPESESESEAEEEKVGNKTIDPIEPPVFEEEKDDEPSLGEDDQPEPKEIKPLGLSSKEPDIQTDSGFESEHEKLPIKTVKLENEPTGYEADEDVSDKKSSPEPMIATSTKNDDIPDITPPLGCQMPRNPQVPQVPPVPSAPIPPVADRAPPVPPVSKSELPPIPPVAQAPPVPPVPTAPITSAPLEEDTEVSEPEVINESDLEDEFEFGAPQRSKTLPPNMPPPIPSTSTSQPPNVPAPNSAPPVPPTPSVPVPGIQRASTDASRLTHTNTGSSMGSFKRTSTDLSRGTQAEICFDNLQNELLNLENSNWWLKDLLPEFLTIKIGSELIFEVDSNQITKRGNRTKVYKDYYILFYDLSQIVFELEYELQDPRTTVKFTNLDQKPIPLVRKDLLDKYYHTYSNEILKIVGGLGNINNNSLVSVVTSKLGGSLPPIGSKSFGVPIYKNVNNHNVSKTDDIRPGDILCIKNGKFQIHKGLGSKTLIVGDEEIYSSIIGEFDPKKEKFKVFESVNGNIKQTSYKTSEMKSGQIRVFRIVGRDYVDW
ncbi:myosin tail region-interacting protein MTI1 [[Candida] jaroonii]|uniref:Myosin tail region-interacting protein MTI1 n=1 Tax=[Candida] jaroonii TaxID=467808 RepID=A0ACA9Y8D4_9ASCO|nr:myosin tail region-interacting protein MTI1 [[Candida] jaroonii]